MGRPERLGARAHRRHRCRWLNGGWYLDFESIDTVASVYVNDELVLQSENCFRRLSARRVGRPIRRREPHPHRAPFGNCRGRGPGRRRNPSYVPYHDGNSPIANGNMLRKPQCHFAGTGISPSRPLGSTARGAPRLETARIEHVTTRQMWLDDGSVDLQVTVQLFAPRSGIVPVHFMLDGVRERLDCAVGAGETRLTHVFTVQEPRRWWPAGSGDQAFSTLRWRCPAKPSRGRSASARSSSSPIRTRREAASPSG